MVTKVTSTSHPRFTLTKKAVELKELIDVFDDYVESQDGFKVGDIWGFKFHRSELIEQLKEMDDEFVFLGHYHDSKGLPPKMKLLLPRNMNVLALLSLKKLQSGDFTPGSLRKIRAFYKAYGRLKIYLRDQMWLEKLLEDEEIKEYIER